MNHSIYSADRATHLKVVIAGLLGGIMIVAAALAFHLTHPDINVQTTSSLAVYKAHPIQSPIKLAQR
ncbi:hypothetical protein P0R31_01190 [Bradyrhizobium yuanmingense]|uniref:hypothetical protein n=1 Tax=Bradyrhizobium yuanmingense TaxID=108015 RepID=UPI0023B8D51D|nr:hypothetical protein [Bradyrhizobium yuanmingense]MDF0515852.1 hypothetical protein [Bradyrhizobium yuanmingense]